MISVLRWVDMKGAWRVRGMTFRFSTCWCARMLQKSVMWRLSKRNPNLLRQSLGLSSWCPGLDIYNDHFSQVIPTILYRKPRLDVTCIVLDIERSERSGFRCWFGHLYLKFINSSLAGRLSCEIQHSEERMHGGVSSNYRQSVWKLYDRQVPAFLYPV